MSFKKYPDIERLGHEENQDILKFDTDWIIIEEKVDGGNGSFWLEEDNVVHFGSRSRDLTAENDTKIFSGFQQKLREHLAKLEENGIKINTDYIYYIEWMQKHTINYTSIPFIIGLDIRPKRSMNTEEPGLFFNRKTKEEEFKRLNMETSPLIWEGTSQELKKLNIYDLIPKSKYYDGFAEGIVIKNYNRKHHYGNHQLYAKIVREEFKEQNQAVFGQIKRKDTETEKIVEEFVTEARVRKQILRYINEENKKLDMVLMKTLFSDIIKDILKEEFSGIYNKYSFIDFKEMKFRTAKKCAHILQNYMAEEASK